MKTSIDKRNLLKILPLAAVSAPWSKPVVQGVLLPAHAATSIGCQSSPQIRVFDNGGGSTTDDSFDVYVDGQFITHVEAPANSNIGSCVSGLTPGSHTLRIEFVEDIDDPDGDDSGQDGSYAIELFQGVTFIDPNPVESNCTVCSGGATSDTFAEGDLWGQGASHQYSISVL